MEPNEQAAAVAQLREKFEVLSAELDERSLRLWAAAEARALGWGGVTRVCEATGLTRPTIHRGLKEFIAQRKLPPHKRGADRVRAAGGGRKRLIERFPGLVKDLESIVGPATRGDPMSPLRWTSKSTRNLVEELNTRGYSVSDRTIAQLLREMGYSLQSNRKVAEGKQHPDRNAQFEYISQLAKRFVRQKKPVISVDTKKKELVGDFKNRGREWQPKGRPERVRTHDFKDKNLGKAIPYGVYDIRRNEGWVNVGITNDTAEFATYSIREWWKRMGAKAYPDAEEILITADGGESNSSRSRLWKVALQRLADDIQLRLNVCHFPPGTSKWNKIEHRMFCHITENWRGRPLLSHEVIVNLIADTRTKKGLHIKAQLDKRKYPTGINVSDEEMGHVNILPAKFHGEWNYLITPREL